MSKVTEAKVNKGKYKLYYYISKTIIRGIVTRNDYSKALPINKQLRKYLFSECSQLLIAIEKNLGHSDFIVSNDFIEPNCLMMIEDYKNNNTYYISSIFLDEKFNKVETNVGKGSLDVNISFIEEEIAKEKKSFDTYLVSLFRTLADAENSARGLRSYGSDELTTINEMAAMLSRGYLRAHEHIYSATAKAKELLELRTKLDLLKEIRNDEMGFYSNRNLIEEIKKE